MGKFVLKVNAVIETRKKDGTVTSREQVHNKIVNTGLEHVARWLAGETGYEAFTHIAIGTSESGDAESASDTALKNEVTREQASRAYEANYKCTYENTFTFASGESYSIEEAGIFDSAVESGSTMLDRFVFAPKAVDADNDLYIKITITVAEA